MKRQNPNRIAELRAARRWSQRELAEVIGVHYMTISKLERGDMKLTQDWMTRLSNALNVSTAEILADSPLKRSIYIEGHISEDGSYSEPEDPSQSIGPVDFELDLGVTPPDTTMWFFVRPPFFGPMAQNASLARFTFIEGAEIDQFIGHVCILELPENLKYVTGVVHRGKNEGSYDLTLPNGGRRRDVRPVSFGVLTLFLPITLFTPENFDGSQD